MPAKAKSKGGPKAAARAAKGAKPAAKPAGAAKLAPRKTAAETIAILDALATQHPNAWTELDFRNAFELLIATILSAQSNDRTVNDVTPGLFARYPDAATLAAATTAELEPQLIPTGFFRQKAKMIQATARLLVERHGGQVPAEMHALTALQGVGRKTANVVLGHALGVPGLPVDRHVLRVANRLAIAQAAEPEDVESQLCAVLPPERWTVTSDTLILHGRRICRPQPLCPQCVVVAMCPFAATLATPGPAPAKTVKAAALPPHKSPPARTSKAAAARARAARR
jgi:endonuclease-3